MRATAPFPAARKDVQEAARWLRSLGWEYVGMVGGHHRFEHETLPYQTLPSSPSVRQWQDAKLSDIAKSLGISRPELQIRLGLRQKKNPNARKRERNVAGVEARRFTPVSEPLKRTKVEPELTPEELKAKLAADIAETNHRLDSGDVGSWLWRSARRELARLRSEYMELESA